MLSLLSRIPADLVFFEVLAFAGPAYGVTPLALREARRRALTKGRRRRLVAKLVSIAEKELGIGMSLENPRLRFLVDVALIGPVWVTCFVLTDDIHGFLFTITHEKNLLVTDARCHTTLLAVDDFFESSTLAEIGYL